MAVQTLTPELQEDDLRLAEKLAARRGISVADLMDQILEAHADESGDD